jgi:hypothetical protein
MCGGLGIEQWAAGLRVRDLPVQEQFEYLLSQCATPWVGDLAGAYTRLLVTSTCDASAPHAAQRVN